MRRIQIKINKPLLDYPLGFIVKVRVDAKGVPFDRFWRDRLRDAEVDNCVSIVKKVLRKPTLKNLDKNEEKSQ